MINVNAALRQARRIIAETINDNPICLRMQRVPLVDNGNGQEVRDPFGDPTVVEVRGRIAPLAYGLRGVQTQESTATGPGVPDTQFLLVKHTEDLQEGDPFDYNGHSWKVGPVENIYRFGGVVAKQAPVKKGATVESA